MTIGETSIIQNLEQGIPHFGVSFFNFIEEHHTVRSATHSFSELTAFFITDISGRRAEQTADRVLLAVLRHINANERFLIIEHEPGKGLGKLGLPHTRRTDEDERSDRAGGIFQPGTRAANGIRNGADGFILTDDAFMQTRFHM